MEEEIKKKKGKEIDMLNGSLLPKLLIFALPLAASSILQQLFNSVDVAVIGQYGSSQSQAAVGGNGSVINLMLNLFIGISVGANVIISRYIGQKKKENIKKAIHTAMLVALIGGIFLLFLGILSARQILTWMNTPDDVLEKAVLYLRIYFLGVPFVLIYNFGAAILRSKGDTKRPLYCLALSGLINVGLNLLLVVVFHLDVAGVAIGTVASNVVSSGMVVAFLVKEQGELHLSIKELAINKEELLQMLKIGVPAGLQSMVFSIANVCIQTALNAYGSDAVAGSAVTLNYEYYIYFMISAFAQTTVTFTSQNYGAGKWDRCRRIFGQTLALSIGVVIFMSVLFLSQDEFFIHIFTSKPRVAEYAAVRMKYLLTLYCMIPLYEIGGAALRGLSYSLTPAVITIFGTCILRLLWIYTVCKKYTSFGALMIVYPISWVITGVTVMAAYLIISRRVLPH